MAMTAVGFPVIRIHRYKFQPKLSPLAQICNFLKSGIKCLNRSELIDTEKNLGNQATA